MPAPTPAECIDRAASLIEAAASQTHGYDERIRLFLDAEIWLQLAKRQLAEKVGKTTPPLLP
jgi:hypothetical protein